MKHKVEVIPKEEILANRSNAYEFIDFHKQETREEASEYFAHNNFNMHNTNNYKALKVGFEEGAKWQQERSYSEEDMINFIQFATQYYANDWMENRSIYELLEQFKNK
jgi:hypothetical protein